MSFLFCAPKEENEVEKEDEKIFFQLLKEKMRSHFETRNSINEAKEEKLQAFKGHKRRGIFVSIRSFIVPIIDELFS